jgi:hypothetical protein
VKREGVLACAMQLPGIGTDHGIGAAGQRVLLNLEWRAQQLGMTLLPDASAPKAA